MMLLFVNLYDMKYDEIHEKNTNKFCRILGISYSPDRDEAGFGAMISAEGEVSDFIKLPQLLTRNLCIFLSPIAIG